MSDPIDEAIAATEAKATAAKQHGPIAGPTPDNPDQPDQPVGADSVQPSAPVPLPGFEGPRGEARFKTLTGRMVAFNFPLDMTDDELLTTIMDMSKHLRVQAREQALAAHQGPLPPKLAVARSMPQGMPPAPTRTRGDN